MTALEQTHKRGEASTHDQILPLDSNQGQVMPKARNILRPEEPVEGTITQLSNLNVDEEIQPPASPSPSRDETTGEEREEASAEALQVDQERRRAALERYQKLRTELFPEVPDISGEELRALLEKEEVGDSVILVDCRSEAERQVSVYKGSVTIADFEENADIYKHREIVAYCAIGRRSGLFLKNLLTRYPGIRVRNHAGSVVDWAHVGGLFVEDKSGSPTNRVHPNGTWAQYLPLARNLEVIE